MPARQGKSPLRSRLASAAVSWYDTSITIWEGKFVMATAQVKSKQRVAQHGEVFTAPREVNAMLDLVKQETERIESRFLESKPW